MAHLSDTLFTTAIAIYALAMVGYTAEYAFGRRGPRSPTDRAEPASWSAPAAAGGRSAGATPPPTTAPPAAAPHAFGPTAPGVAGGAR